MIGQKAAKPQALPLGELCFLCALCENPCKSQPIARNSGIAASSDLPMISTMSSIWLWVMISGGHITMVSRMPRTIRPLAMQ